MIRMLSLVAVAATALAGAGLTPTPAAACDGGYRPDLCGPRVYFGPPVSFGYGNCYARELLQTPWGPRWRLVNRCP